jgi:hypothetical protein
VREGEGFVTLCSRAEILQGKGERKIKRERKKEIERFVNL